MNTPKNILKEKFCKANGNGEGVDHVSAKTRVHF